MDIFELIRVALKEPQNKFILDFMGFRVEEELGGGDQSVVLKLGSQIGKKFALKLYRPPLNNLVAFNTGAADFVREVRILAFLNHKNIARIVTAGSAKWSPEAQKWHITEGLEQHDAGDGDTIYFYIMDYIDESVKNILPTSNSEREDRTAASRNLLERKLFLFEELAMQICAAMGYYHSKGITHKDIKADNIGFNSDDTTFILVDFGNARHLTSSDPSRQGDDMVANSSQSQGNIRIDIEFFAIVLRKILPTLRDLYGESRFQDINNVLDQAINSSGTFSTAPAFLSALQANFIALGHSHWNMALRLGEWMTPLGFGEFRSKVRIPVSGSILLTKEVCHIIDTPEFQRLRGVRQLGPTGFVFPGATHTRFEHSLGTYWLSLRYLERLSRIPDFQELCEPMDETIKMVVLAALLHDIGHYPYSHWIEEIGELPVPLSIKKHEARAKDIITNSSIFEQIKKVWGVNPDDVCAVIADDGGNRKTTIANSIVDSPIDVDKLDYLVRDSVHCGVEYGKGIDVERFLDALHFDKTLQAISLGNKGRSLLLSILTCRNIMYQEVYWHKTVRACDSMFKRFFYEYVRARISTPKIIDEILNYPDELFLIKLYDNTKKHLELRKLINPFVLKGRCLYKAVYVYSRVAGNMESKEAQDFFGNILDQSSDYQKLVSLSERLAEVLRAINPDIKSLDILVDKAPIKVKSEEYDLVNISVWNPHKHWAEKQPREVTDLDKYLSSTQQAYIYCHPDYYDCLRNISGNEWKTIFRELK